MSPERFTLSRPWETGHKAAAVVLVVVARRAAGQAVVGKPDVSRRALTRSALFQRQPIKFRLGQRLLAFSHRFGCAAELGGLFGEHVRICQKL